MSSSRLLLLPAFAFGALAMAAHGCAAQPQSTGGFGNGDDGGSSGSSGDDGGTGGSSSGGTTSSSSSSGGTSSAATSSSTSSGGTTSSSSSSGGTTSSSSSSGGTTAAPCPSPGTLIDNMTGTGGAIITCGGRMGFWYTYDDGTGTLTPPPMMPFPYTAIVPPGPPGAAADGGAGLAAMMTGMGFTTYGAGMGFDLSNAGGAAAKGTYNASAYGGVTFWAMGAAGGVVRFNVPDKDTDPSGGVCSGSSTSQCNDHHGHTLTLTTSWQQFTFTWSQLTQQGYGYVEASINSAALVGMQWQVNSPTGTFDVWVSDVAFTP